VSSSTRPRRPHLDRTAPHRGFTGLFVGPGESSGAAEPPFAAHRDDASPQPTAGASSSRDPSAPAPGADDVADGVGIGYRLIEEYLRHGQQVAQTTWPADIPSFGGSGGVAPERLLQYTTQVAGLWFEQLREAFQARPPQGSTEPLGGFSYVTPKTSSTKAATPESQANVSKPSPPLVVLNVETRKPIEVSFDLHAECHGRELAVFDLRTSRGDGPRIEHVTATWLDERRIRLTLRVPEAQPAGAYASVVVEAGSNVPVGTLSLRILPG